jgi:hypothetical protein
MNHDIPPFDDDAREREWQAQERAMRAERLGLDPAGDDARVRRYRLLARALRQPPPETLPTDFARQVAARIGARTPAHAFGGGSLESVLLAVLVGVFAVAAAIVLVGYGPAWLSAVRAALPADDPRTLRWPLSFAGCLGLSWLLWQWQRRAQHRPLA